MVKKTGNGRWQKVDSTGDIRLALVICIVVLAYWIVR